jgi:type II secretory pathway pseudopilin PulG
MSRISRLRARSRDERGFTLTELLVGAGMGIVLMGAVATLVVSALKYQPNISKKAENVTSARWALERMTRELRNGERIEVAEPSRVVFIGYSRRSPCGSGTTLGEGQPSIPCRITYSCTTTSCSRIEAPPSSAANSGTPQMIFSGINSNQVFTYQPSAIPAEVTYVKATLRMPDPRGSGSLTISDGASLRNATLSY